MPQIFVWISLESKEWFNTHSINRQDEIAKVISSINANKVSGLKSIPLTTSIPLKDKFFEQLFDLFDICSSLGVSLKY